MKDTKQSQKAAVIEAASMGFRMHVVSVASFTKVHQHSEVEVSLLHGGAASLLFGETRRERLPDKLGLLWGLVPHGAIRVEQGTPIGYSLHLPLALFISWRLPTELVAAVLHGRFLEDDPRDEPCTDLAIMNHWCRLLAGNEAADREIVIHELQARLRLFARSKAFARLSDSHGPRAADRSSVLVEKMLAEIHASHAEPLTIHRVARAAGIGPDHAMHVFRELVGASIYEYLTRCRIFTAQRLLATTDDKVAAIGRVSGFRSADCFHDAFRRICGVTPGQYRRQIVGV